MPEFLQSQQAGKVTMNQKEQWQVSGSEAELYELYKVPRIFRASAELLLERVPPKPGQRVLDVACGTGIVARMVATRAGAAARVVGLDLNESMLAVASANAPSDAVPIEWRQGNAQALPFENDAFDQVYCQQGLQFFPDKTAALREMRRVLAPGGTVILSVWALNNPYNTALAEGLEKYADATAASLSLKPFTLSDPHALRALVSNARFGAIDIEKGTITRHVQPTQEWLLQDTSGLPYSSTISDMDSSVRAAMIREIAAKLKPYWTGDCFAVPAEMNIVVAKK
jgi:ubiquinone/menaquinone biosynthesis C-methylase UbiE